MDQTTLIVGVVIVLPVLLVVWCVSMANRIIRLKNLVREAWAQVDVVLKRRYDLIPNLVETCRAYAAHEKEVFEMVTKRREEAVASHGGVSEENAMVRSVNTMLARVEAYPALRSSANFLELQRELANTEDRIAAARRFYNSNVRDYNMALEQFPSSLFTRGAEPAEFFEVESVEIRTNPSIA